MLFRKEYVEKCK